MNKHKNVFISHHSKDDDHIQQMKDLLYSKGYTIKNSSVDSTKPNRLTSEAAIKRLLKLRIHWAGTFICLIGPETHSRKWVDWEIKKAHQKGKRIIGVFVHGAKEDSRIPESLKKYGHGLTGMNSGKIIDALEGKDIGWCDHNDHNYVPSWNLDRIKCQ